MPLFCLLPHQGQQEPEENIERQPEEKQSTGHEKGDMGGTVTWHLSLLSIGVHLIITS